MTEAIRGEGATLHDAAGERFVDELAPRDEVSRAIQELLDATGRALGRPRHAGDRPGPLPERRRRPARGRPRPVARARAGRAGGPLHDGRDRHRSRRALDRRRASTRSASPPAPGCTAPTGSPRTRSASASCSPAARSPMRWRGAASAARARRARAELGAARAAGARRGEPATREALWRDAGIVRDRRGLRAAARGPPPARPPDRALRAGARGEPRRAPARRLPRARPGLDHRHAVRQRGGRARLADLALSR